mmetsp:Transcript_64325/g.199369  ORF Transcript_64325/g.199369 Transcript_64325/m.199369 type:complete len:412 (-) Transcript_64325:194-1429(-)
MLELLGAVAQPAVQLAAPGLHAAHLLLDEAGDLRLHVLQLLGGVLLSHARLGGEAVDILLVSLGTVQLLDGVPHHDDVPHHGLDLLGRGANGHRVHDRGEAALVVVELLADAGRPRELLDLLAQLVVLLVRLGDGLVKRLVVLQELGLDVVHQAQLVLHKRCRVFQHLLEVLAGTLVPPELLHLAGQALAALPQAGVLDDPVHVWDAGIVLLPQALGEALDGGGAHPAAERLALPPAAHGVESAAEPVQRRAPPRARPRLLPPDAHEVLGHGQLLALVVHRGDELRDVPHVAPALPPRLLVPALQVLAQGVRVLALDVLHGLQHLLPERGVLPGHGVLDELLALPDAAAQGLHLAEPLLAGLEAGADLVARPGELPQGVVEGIRAALAGADDLALLPGLRLGLGRLLRHSL